jgi:hypothetical protein
MKAWTSGPALLVSQGVTFAGNYPELIDNVTAKTPEELKNIRELKQFGMPFDGGVPKTLPFDIRKDTVIFRNGRYAVSRVPVQWNDPNGDWTLVLLGDLDALMSGPLSAMTGGASGGLALALSLLFLAWRQRLNRADALRLRAEEDAGQCARLEAVPRPSLPGRSFRRPSLPLAAGVARKFLFHAAPRWARHAVVYVLGRKPAVDSGERPWRHDR